MGPARLPRPTRARASRSPGGLRDHLRHLTPRRVCGELARPLRTTPGAPHAQDPRWFGEVDGTLAQVRADKAAAFAIYGPAWPSDDEAADDLRRRLEELQPLTREVLAALQRMGVPDAMGFLGVDAPLLRASLRFANRLRNRFTALDLLEAQGALDREIGELVPTRQ